MKLYNTMNIELIDSVQPEQLLLYNIVLTDDDVEFLNSCYRYIKKLTITGNVYENLRLAYPIIQEGHGVVIYETNKYLIELDITTKCNLACNNCNRFSNYKSHWEELSFEDIQSFANTVDSNNTTICLIGGEPMVHKDIHSIIKYLTDKGFHLTISTNGLLHIPYNIYIENSYKIKGQQPIFTATMDAPIDDDTFKDDDFSLGCHKAYTCGYGYSRLGFYTCSIAKALDLVLVKFNNKKSSGMPSIEEAEKHKKDAYADICKYCGTYRAMNFKQRVIESTDEEIISKSWYFMKELKNV